VTGSGESGYAREMGYSVDEFALVLPSAMRDWSVQGGPDSWRVTNSEGTPVATISISALPERALGSLRLPVLSVRFALQTRSAELSAEFQRRFDRGFHRGGG
jgi:hypothetical protein